MPTNHTSKQIPTFRYFGKKPTTPIISAQNISAENKEKLCSIYRKKHQIEQPYQDALKKMVQLEQKIHLCKHSKQNAAGNRTDTLIGRTPLESNSLPYPANVSKKYWQK